MAAGSAVSTLFLLLLLFIFCHAQQAINLQEPTDVIFIEKGNYNYYSVALSDDLQASQNLYVVLTPISGGDPDLYGSTAVPTPQKETAQYSSAAWSGIDMISLNNTIFQGRTLYFSVYASRGDVSYTVIAYIYDTDGNNRIKVKFDVPQISFLDVNQMLYYEVQSTLETGQLVFSNSDMYGDTNIYISRTNQKPGPSSSEWRAEASGSDILTIPASAVTYYVGIRATTAAAFALSVSTITPPSETSSKWLPEGYSLRGTVVRSTYNYYQFNVTTFGAITISLVKRSWNGEPDLYVSNTESRPTRTNNIWSSGYYGSDTLRIESTDPNFRLGMYYVAVYNSGFSATTYDISFTSRSFGLVAGKPFTSGIDSGKSEFFKFFVPTSTEVENLFMDVAVTANSGDILFCASTTEFPSVEGCANPGERQGATITYQQDKPVAGSWYYFTVFGSTQANFTISVSTGKRPYYLVNANPLVFSVRSTKYIQFIFDVETDDIDVTISIAPTSGDPDIYVHTVPNPSKDSYKWYSSTGRGLDIVTVKADDPKLRDGTYTGRLYIAVYGYSSATCSITAYANNATIALTNGVAVAGSVEYNQYVYYKYYMSGRGRLSFNLQCLDQRKDGDFFISTRTTQPTRYLYEYRSIRLGSDYLSIDADAGYYYIGVYGASAAGNVTYSFTVSADNIVLSAFGYSMIDSVAKGTYKYFSTSMQENDHYVAVTLITGSTSLYVNTNSTYPTAGASARSDSFWPGNFIAFYRNDPGYVNGRHTIGVYGEEDSLFYIHASTIPVFQSVLRTSEPKFGVAQPGTPAYFRFESLDTNQNYAIFVRMFSRTLNEKIAIYADQYPNNQPNATSYKWKQATEDDLVLSITKDLYSGTGYLTVGIETLSNVPARFTITLYQENDPISLTQEQPLDFYTQSGVSDAFQLYSPRDSTGLELYVESCTSVPPPAFYVSKTNSRPNSTDNDFQSSPITPFIQAVTTPSKLLNGIYYVATESATTSTLSSIYGFTKQDMRPKPGSEGTLEIRGMVAVGKVEVAIPSIIDGRYPVRYLVYKYVLSEGELPENVNMKTVCGVMNLGAIIGQVDVPPSSPPTVYIEVPVVPSEKFIINVIAEDKFGLRTVYKPVSFTTPVGNLLEPGSPLRGSVNKTDMIQFILAPFEDIPNTASVGFILTPVNGDVDIFISTSRPPTTTEYTWKGTNGGFDAIFVSRTDSQYTAGPYYVGVYGSTDAEFTILAYFTHKTITLRDGQPQLASTSRLTATQFTYNLDESSDFSVSTTPISGNPDIYMALTPYAGPRNYIWTSTFTGVDVLQVSTSHPRFVAQSTYYMGIFSYNTMALYTIVASKALSITTLYDGIPVAAALTAGKTAYFKFNLILARSLILTVTPYTQRGDPDMFVSTTNTRPDIGGYQWSARKQGIDTLQIEPSDPQWIQGEYYIAIFAYMHDLTFQITASTSGQSLTLADGIPQDVSSGAGQWRYFRFFNGYVENILEFTASPITGGNAGIEMFGSKSVAQPSGEQGKYDYRYRRNGAITMLTVVRHVGWIFVGVYTPVTTNYTMTVASDQNPTLLVEGRQLIDIFVPQDHYKYFVMPITADMKGQDLHIATVSAFGDPDMYITADNVKPTKDEYTWKSDKADADSFTIPANQIPSNATRIIIGVHAYSASRFSILAYGVNSTTNLQDGTPTPGRVGANKYVQYKFELTTKSRLTVNLQVQSAYPSEANIYLDTKPYPNEGRFLKKSAKFGNDYIDYEEAEAGTYYISVQGQFASTSFTITASTLYAYLIEGQAVIDHASEGTHRYFTATVDTRASHVMAAVTLVNGRTAIYANPNSVLPTKDSYTFKSEGWPGNVLYVPYSDPAFTNGTWTFAVFGVEESAYFVSIQTRQGRLVPGQPRRGKAANNLPTRYIYPISSNVQQDHFVNIKVFSRTTCVKVYLGQDEYHWPNTTTYKWQGVSDPYLENQNMITLKKEGIDWITNLFVSVYSCDPQQTVEYEIVVASQEEPTYLTQDYPDVFPLKEHNHYALFSAKNAKSVNIELDSCTDRTTVNTHLYVSSDPNIKYPEKKDAEYVSTPLSKFSIAVRDTKTFKPNTQYYINLVDESSSQESEGFVFSFFSSTKGYDVRPSVGVLKPSIKYNQLVSTETGSKYQFTLSFEPAASKSPVLTYQVVAVPQKVGLQNLFTVCAIRNNRDTQYVKIFKSHINNQTISTDIELPTDKVYFVNVIVVDEDGLENVYQYPVIANPPGRGVQWIGVGDVLLIILIVIIACYITIGSIYKAVKLKKRGLEALPHIEFWKELPLLVIDGIKYLFLCEPCRKREYSKFRDEEGAGEDHDDDEASRRDDVDEGDPNPFKLSRVEENNGYGAIE